MAITAFTSTAIIDATTIGTTVLTASTEGIAADSIGLGATDDVTFNSINSVDGSFSGSLNSEVGGSYKLYNLGSEGDTDTEYGGMWWDTNACYVGNRKSGAGANRQLNFAINGSARWAISTDGGLIPIGNRNLGTNGSRPDTVFAVDGNFNGTVTMSGLPTSDPLVAGQLYTTTGGALKVSAG